VGTITPDLSGIVDGQVADAVDFTNPLNTITNEINGGLDSDNLADNAVTTAKITSANVTTAKLETELQHGWQDPSDTWSYASATTINVSSGATSVYSVGDKIRFKQTAGTYVYFYVTAVADALLTVTGGSDYTVANEAITANYYSKSSSPVGFPQWFAYTTTRAVSGGTAPTYGTSISKFRISSRTVEVKWFWRNTTGNQAGEGANSLTATIPVTGVFKDSAYASGLECLGLGHSYENGGTIGLVSIVPLSATAVGMALSNTTTIKGDDQSADARVISASFSYEI
jgi:hypothetical protein